MNKKKQQSSKIGRRSMVALLALVMMISVCLTGITASAGTVETEPTESASSSVESEAADVDQDPEVTALYEQLMSYTDAESYWAFLDTMTGEEQDALFAQFTEEQQNAIWAHVDELTEDVQSGYDDKADALYNRLMNISDPGELLNALNGLTEDDKIYIASFTDEQTNALDAKISTMVQDAFAGVSLTATATIIENGRITVTPDAAAPNGITYVYTWQKNGEDIEQIPYDYDGDGENIQYNVDENGAWVNAALVQGASKDPEEKATYTVQLTGVKINALDKTYSVNNDNITTIDSPYFAQLKNGSFENPDVYMQTFVPEGTDGLYWNTTDSANQVEIITEVRTKNYGDTVDSYDGYYLSWSDNAANNRTLNHDAYWHGVMFMPDGDQCAEINANGNAALYQDVLTIPGVSMNWAVDHMGRPVSSGKYYPDDTSKLNQEVTDSMFVVIMSTEMAEKAGYRGGPVDTMEEVQDVRDAIVSEEDGYEGAKVIDISYTWVWRPVTSDLNRKDGIAENEFRGGYRMYRIDLDENGNKIETPIYTLYNSRLYQHNDPWVVHESSYDVPDEQYVTRFFFVSNGSSKGDSYSVGNHIDNIWFGQDPRPAESGVANLIIEKTLTGLTSEVDIEAAKKGLSFTVTVNGQEKTILGTQLVWNGNVGTYTVPSNFYTSSVGFTVTEKVASIDNFNLTGTVVTSNDNGNTTTVNDSNKSAAGSLVKGETETISFTNTYAPKTTTVTVSKEVSGNMGDWNKDFKFTVGLDNGKFSNSTYTVTDKDGEGQAQVPITENAASVDIYLKHGESVEISNVPIGATLTVTESDNEGYTVTTAATTKDSDGTVAVTDTNENASIVSIKVPANGATIAYTNDNDVEINTGISMDSLPYVLLLSVAVAGAIVLMLNKRRHARKA